VTLYVSRSNQRVVTRYTAGQSFIERPGEVADAVNTGSIPTLGCAASPKATTRIDSFTLRATSPTGLLHEVLHTEPFGESGEMNRARLKTVRPSNSDRI